MTRRRPTPSIQGATFPALVTFLAACARNATTGDAQGTSTPPLPPQPPHPPIEADSGVAPFESVVLIPPDHPRPLAGAPMMVTPRPPPPPEPAPAPAPAAPPPPPHPLLAGREPGVYLVHDHPQGTPCRPVSQTEVDALRQQLAPR